MAEKSRAKRHEEQLWSRGGAGLRPLEGLGAVRWLRATAQRGCVGTPTPPPTQSHTDTPPQHPDQSEARVFPLWHLFSQVRQPRTAALKFLTSEI